MFRRVITNSKLIAVILIVQLVPFILLPASSFTATSQEWWLPAVLMVLSTIAVVELLINRATIAVWAWHLLAFAQGFNLISRMMLLFPHMTKNVKGVQEINTLYIVLTAVSMALSVFMLWYVELPEVKVGLLKEEIGS